jgi:hypothetical protein
VFREELFFVLGNGGGYLFAKIVMNHHGAAPAAELSQLPGFVERCKGFIAYAAYMGMYFHIRSKLKLAYKIVIRVGHDQVKGSVGKVDFRGKNAEEGITGLFKPYGEHGIVDVSEYIHIPKAGRYNSSKHADSNPLC